MVAEAKHTLLVCFSVAGRRYRPMLACKGANLPQCYMQNLIVDCANGIGAQHLQTLSQHLQTSGFSVVAKCTGEGVLNGGCGADDIQKERAMPHTFESVSDGSRCVCAHTTVGTSWL